MRRTTIVRLDLDTMSGKRKVVNGAEQPHS